MIIHRSLIGTIVIALAVVWIAAAIKVAREPVVHQPSTTDTSSVSRDDIPHIDQEFLIPEKINESGTPVKPVGVPGVTARAYLVGNVKTGKIYLEKNSSRVMPVASMSKLVTAFVATDMFSPTTTVTVTEQSMAVPPDGSNLKPGEHFSLEEILNPLLLNSSNVAAEAIASTTNRAAFMEMMRSYAWEVGMPHSFFADPSGINPQNAASAQDLFGLAKYLMFFRPDILALTHVASSTIATTTDHGSHTISSTHPFVKDPRFIGGKTGRTEEAGETMMTILNLNGQPIVFVILGSRYGSREFDTRLLITEVEPAIAP